MNFCKIRKVKSPARATTRAGGIDFWTPEFEDEMLNSLEKKNEDQISKELIYVDRCLRQIIVCPGATVSIPSGIKTDMTSVDGGLYDEANGLMMIAMNKSGVSTKLQLDSAAVLVDEDYQGEIHLSVTNASGRLVKIVGDMKLIQFVVIAVKLDSMVEVDEQYLFSQTSERGISGFGSEISKYYV